MDNQPRRISHPFSDSADRFVAAIYELSPKTYIFQATRGYALWRPDAVMSTIGQMMKNFTSHEENIYRISIDDITQGMFHRINPDYIEDKYWCTSSMNESSPTNHLLRVYGVYKWKNDLYLASEVYECTLETWINKSTTTITVQNGIRLNDNFQEMLKEYFINMHVHPALLNEKKKCLSRAVAYLEVVEVRSGVKFNHLEIGWLNNVPLSLYKSTGLSHTELDRSLNNISDGFFALWFDTKSTSGFELSWCPK